MKNNIETWIIVHKETGKQFMSVSGKSSWRGKGHAKNAFNASYKYHSTPAISYWSDQDEWELKEISLSRIRELEEENEELRQRLGRLSKWG